MLSLDPASVPHGGNWARPGWWDTISTQGVVAVGRGGGGGCRGAGQFLMVDGWMSMLIFSG